MDLTTFFKNNPKCALAISGGVDSGYLLYAACRQGAEVCAYYVKTALQPQFELEDALRLAKQLQVSIKVLSADILDKQTVTENPADRCYYCKRIIFETIARAADADGFKVLLDGTNASDQEADRARMRALRELSVKSPLRECGLTKERIRALSKEAGLITWDKPAYACLATRIQAGEQITAEKLNAVEQAENYLFSLGFTDFRVRMTGMAAKLQIREEQLEKAVVNREKIVTELKKYFTSVLLDLEMRT